MLSKTYETGGLRVDKLVNTGKPSLAHFTVVNGLVRDFMADLLALKSGFDSGNPDAKYPLLEIDGIEVKAQSSFSFTRTNADSE